MNIREKWSQTLKNNIDGGGVMSPAPDPFDPSAFYVTDGWGSYYNSIRLRRLSLETGEELASVLTRDAVRCLWFEEDALFALLSKRVVRAARPSMEVLDCWRRGIPACSDYAAFDGEKTLLSMNWAASYLSILELGEAKARRKRLESCCGIFREDSRRFLVMNGAGIYRCTLPEGSLQKLADTKPYYRCLRGGSGRLYLLRSGEEDWLTQVLIYPPPGEETEGLAPERIFQVPWLRGPKVYIALSRDEETVYFMQGDFLWAWSVSRGKPLFRHSFQDEYVSAVFDNSPQGASILTYNRDKRRLVCWAPE